MMYKKIDCSADNSKKITPCTTVPTSPNSETSISEFYSNSKRGLIKNYELKVVSLFEILGKITIELNQRTSKIQEKSQNTEKKRLYLSDQQSVRSLTQRYSVKSQLFDDLSVINQDLIRKVETLEQNNKKNLILLEEMKEKVNEGSVIYQATDRNIDDINRSLVKLYGQKDEKLKILNLIRNEKEKALETEKLVKNAIGSLSTQLGNISKHRQLVDKKKIALSENLSELENQKIRVFRLKILNERLGKQVQDSHLSIENMKNKHFGLVESLKNRILSIETIAERIQIRGTYFILHKKKIQQESTRIFNRSLQIFELLKLLESKTQEIDDEFTLVDSRERTMQEKIFQLKVLLKSELSHNIVLNQLSPQV